jgi:hypothetical protein
MKILEALFPFKTARRVGQTPTIYVVLQNNRTQIENMIGAEEDRTI